MYPPFGSMHERFVLLSFVHQAIRKAIFREPLAMVLAAIGFIGGAREACLIRTRREGDAFDLGVDVHALGQAEMLPGAPRHPRQ